MYFGIKRDNNYISNNNFANLDNIINQNSKKNINDLYFNESSIYNNNNDNIKTDFISQNLKSKIIPFQMKPFQTFDHKKLDFKYNNSIIFDNKDESIIINNQNSLNKINDDKCCSCCLKKIDENILNIKEDSNIINKISDNSNNTKKEGIKLHSSMFFQNCKKLLVKMIIKNCSKLSNYQI